MKTTIIAVRHGETHWNRAGKYQGHLDSNLTDRGVKQAVLMGQALKAFNIDSFYSSDIGRAAKTAEIISGKTYPADYFQSLFYT